MFDNVPDWIQTGLMVAALVGSGAAGYTSLVSNDTALEYRIQRLERASQGVPEGLVRIETNQRAIKATLDRVVDYLMANQP